METFRIIFIAAVACGLAVYLRTYFIKKAMHAVIELFYRLNALTAKNAKTRQELGLMPQRLADRLTKRRDYRQSALHILVQRGIVATTEEGKLYLVEGLIDPSIRDGGRKLRSTGK
jgi:hypothetical protein